MTDTNTTLQKWDPVTNYPSVMVYPKGRFVFNRAAVDLLELGSKDIEFYKSSASSIAVSSCPKGEGKSTTPHNSSHAISAKSFLNDSNIEIKDKKKFKLERQELEGKTVYFLVEADEQ